jgi:hypothetical protein
MRNNLKDALARRKSAKPVLRPDGGRAKVKEVASVLSRVGAKGAREEREISTA